MFFIGSLALVLNTVGTPQLCALFMPLQYLFFSLKFSPSQHCSGRDAKSESLPPERHYEAVAPNHDRMNVGALLTGHVFWVYRIRQ